MSCDVYNENSYFSGWPNRFIAATSGALIDTSYYVSADVSFRSPWEPFIFISKKYIFWIKVSKQYFMWFWKHKNWLALVQEVYATVGDLDDGELTRRSLLGFGEVMATLALFGVGPHAVIRRSNIIGATRIDAAAGKLSRLVIFFQPIYRLLLPEHSLFV